MSETGHTGGGWVGRLAVSAGRLLARPVAASSPVDAPALSGRIAVLALAHPEAAENETLELVRALLDRDLSVVLAHREDTALAPLRGMIGRTPRLVPVAAAVEGPFALWQAALAATALPHPGTASLLLLSTRLRGPFAPLAGLLDRTADFAAADIWGLTESWTGVYHLPSCFLSIGPRALGDPAWERFWSALPAFSNHPAVAQHLEATLTQSLLAAGLTAAAAYPYQSLLEQAGEGFAALRTAPPHTEAARARATHLRRVRTLQANRAPMEPLNFFWEELLDLGAPFVARELLDRNPYGIATARQAPRGCVPAPDRQPTARRSRCSPAASRQSRSTRRAASASTRSAAP